MAMSRDILKEDATWNGHLDSSDLGMSYRGH